MAKAKKSKAAAKSTSPKKTKLTKASLVASASATSLQADVEIIFTSGLGQATAVLFRNGVLINMQSISISGTIHFTDVQSRDSIAVNGVCAGDAVVTISIPTNPMTPEHFTAGIIMAGYTIL
jgi:hypothetical protein